MESWLRSMLDSKPGCGHFLNPTTHSSPMSADELHRLTCVHHMVPVKALVYGGHALACSDIQEL